MTMQKPNNVEARPDSGAGLPVSRQVNWAETYAFAQRLAHRLGVVLDHTAVAGTPSWCGLPDSDARKLLALVIGGVREAVSNDARQAAMAEGSRSVAAAADWRTVGQPRGAAYIPREVA